MKDRQVCSEHFAGVGLGPLRAADPDLSLLLDMESRVKRLRFHVKFCHDNGIEFEEDRARAAIDDLSSTAAMPVSYTHLTLPTTPYV